MSLLSSAPLVPVCVIPTISLPTISLSHFPLTLQFSLSLSFSLSHSFNFPFSLLLFPFFPLPLFLQLLHQFLFFFLKPLPLFLDFPDFTLLVVKIILWIGYFSLSTMTVLFSIVCSSFFIFISVDG